MENAVRRELARASQASPCSSGQSSAARLKVSVLVKMFFGVRSGEVVSVALVLGRV